MQKSDPLISPARRGEERAEDQLDRLAETIRLTVARAAQLEAWEPAGGVESPQLGLTSRNSEGLEGWEEKSESELGCGECEEVEEYWRGLLDRANMEQEDIRAQALVLLQRVQSPAFPATPKYPQKSHLSSILTLSLSPASRPSQVQSFTDPLPSLSPTSHSPDPYQHDLDEAYFRLRYYKKHVLPRDIARGIEEERRYLRRVGQIRRAEVEKLEKARRELERTREDLREEVKKVKIARELLSKDRNSYLRSSTSLSPFPDSPSPSPDFDYLFKEISSLIEGIDSSKPPKSKGEVGDLELRCKLAIAVIEDKTGNSAAIQREIASISQAISLFNPRLFGIRRVQTLLTFAQSKLAAQQFHLQLREAKQNLQEMNRSVLGLEKIGGKGKEIGRNAVPEGLSLRLEPENALKQARISVDFCTTASSIPGLNDSCLSLPRLDEKCRPSKWANLVETVKAQEELIDRLRDQLGSAQIRLKEVDVREVRVREKEAGLQTAEKQLALLKQYMEQRVTKIKGKEERLKVRERAILGLIAAGDSLSAVKTQILDLRDRLEAEEAALSAERSSIEQLHLKLKSTQGALSCKAHYLHSLQKLLGRQHCLQVQEKARFEGIRGDLARLLPVLQRCEG